MEVVDTTKNPPPKEWAFCEEHVPVVVDVLVPLMSRYGATLLVPSVLSGTLIGKSESGNLFADERGERDVPLLCFFAQLRDE